MSVQNTAAYSLVLLTERSVCGRESGKVLEIKGRFDEKQDGTADSGKQAGAAACDEIAHGARRRSEVRES